MRSNNQGGSRPPDPASSRGDTRRMPLGAVRGRCSISHSHRCRFGALTPDGYHVETYTGAYLDISRPDPADIRLTDIAAGLSNICRGGGQIPFFSVAEHALLVSSRLRALGYPPEVVMAGLHHDDPEAYIQDLVKPVKELIARPRWQGWLPRPRARARRMPYERIERRLWEAISIALGLGGCDIHSGAVKQADTWALAAESHYLRRSRGRTWYCHGAYDPTEQPLQLGLSSSLAATLWIAEHVSLVAELEKDAREPQERGSTPCRDATPSGTRRPTGTGWADTRATRAVPAGEGMR